MSIFELMYDAVTVANLPAGGTKYAGYVNGSFANHDAMQAAHPTARVFGIDVLGIAWESAAIIDYEPGDVQSGKTLTNFTVNRNKFRPNTAVVYSDRDELDDVETILRGIPHSIWLATLDGTDLTGQHTAAGTLIVATQIKGGIHAKFDVSNTLASWR